MMIQIGPSHSYQLAYQNIRMAYAQTTSGAAVHFLNIAAEHRLDLMSQKQYPDGLELKLCGNCVQVAANDEWSGVEDSDPVPLHLVPRGLYVIVTCHGEDCPDSCEPGECTAPHDNFRGWKCDGCGQLPGEQCSAIAVVP